MKYTKLFFVELPHQIEQINTIVILKLKLYSTPPMAKIIADTSAKVRVFSLGQAKQWDLYDKIYKSNTKHKPFNNKLLSVEGQALCLVSFSKNSVLVKWHITAQDC